MPILTVAQYRAFTGQADDPPSDADIQLALYRYEALIEGYCQREFSLVERQEKYIDNDEDPLQLNHWPVTEVATVEVGGVETDLAALVIHYAAGLIYHAGALYYQTPTITYTAGYQDAPYEIKTVLATLVKGYLDGVSGGINEIRPVSSETVFGVGRTDYKVSAADVAAYAAGGAYAELGSFTSTLDKYRRVSIG